MKIYSSYNNIKLTESIVTVGFFDGIHTGHKQILEKLTDISNKESLQSVVITFWPHPRKIVDPDTPVFMLLTLDEKIKLFEQFDINHLIIMPFTPEFSLQSPEQFCDFLVQQLGMKILIIGYDHHFGNARSGDKTFLTNHSKKNNYTIQEVPAYIINGNTVSSTKIRNALSAGEVAIARQFLGYPYQISGTVIPGKRKGTTLGFPTANISWDSPEKVIPADGVYAVTVLLHQHKYQGMLNIGNNPTIPDKKNEHTAEVHLFNFAENIYNEKISIQFIERLRPEIKFNDEASLIEQLQKDKEKAILILNST